MPPLRVLSIFGTRPEAVKMAPVVLKLAQTPGIESAVWFKNGELVASAEDELRGLGNPKEIPDDFHQLQRDIRDRLHAEFGFDAIYPNSLSFTGEQ